MKVRATQLGYYGNVRIQAGTVFDIHPVEGVTRDNKGKKKKLTLTPEQQFSEVWMEKVSEKEAKPEKSEKPKTDKKKSEEVI